MPAELNGTYHSVRPFLRGDQQHSRLATVCSGLAGVGSSRMYTAISKFDGRVYTLRRIEGNKFHEAIHRMTHCDMTAVGFRGGQLQLNSAMLMIEKWKRVRHSAVVALCDVFVTKAFGDTCKRSIYARASTL
jgi:hypothetical protein